MRQSFDELPAVVRAAIRDSTNLGVDTSSVISALAPGPTALLVSRLQQADNVLCTGNNLQLWSKEQLQLAARILMGLEQPSAEELGL